MKIIRIKGPQGSGKTRLAKVIAGEYKQVYWVQARDVPFLKSIPDGVDLVVVEEAGNHLEAVGAFVFHTETKFGDDAPDFLIETQQ